MVVLRPIHQLHMRRQLRPLLDWLAQYTPFRRCLHVRGYARFSFSHSRFLSALFCCLTSSSTRVPHLTHLFMSRPPLFCESVRGCCGACMHCVHKPRVSVCATACMAFWGESSFGVSVLSSQQFH